MELQLTREERALLLEILQEHHRDLLKEISHTGHPHFKFLLTKNEKLIEAMLEKVARMEIEALTFS